MPAGLCPAGRQLRCRPNQSHPPPMPDKMRAIVKPTAGPGLIMTEVPVPRPGVNDVLIKIKKTSICGTDDGRLLDLDEHVVDAGGSEKHTSELQSPDHLVC